MALVSVQWFTMNRLFQWWCSTQKKQKGFTPAWATNQVAMNQDLPSESPKNCVDVKLCHCCSLMQNYIHSSHSSSYIFSVFDLVISSYIAFSSICWYVYIYTHQLLNVYIYIYIYTDVYLAYMCIYSIQTDIASSTLETSRGAGFNRGGSSLKGCPSITWAETVLMMFIFHILLLEDHTLWIIIIYYYNQIVSYTYIYGYIHVYIYVYIFMYIYILACYFSLFPKTNSMEKNLPTIPTLTNGSVPVGIPKIVAEGLKIG